MVSKKVQVTVSDKMLECLDDWCSRTGFNRSTIIRTALLYYLNKVLYEIVENPNRE